MVIVQKLLAHLKYLSMFQMYVFEPPCSIRMSSITGMINIITKLPESGDLCGNNTEFGVEEGDPSATPNSVILPYRSPDESCFVFISYCLMIL